MKTHHDLDVWKKAIELVTLLYKYTEHFPSREIYGLTNQIRRSAVSIPSNISEGAARNTPKEFNYYLSISLGSIAELETQLIISQNLGFLESVMFDELHAELVVIRKMIIGLKKSLNI